jgi:DNA-binding NtrC family response regulator
MNTKLRLLIVDDDYSVANVIRELLWCHDRENGRKFQDIEIAGDLKKAIWMLSRSDAVVDACLCDGNFPLRPNEQAGSHWKEVASLCNKMGVKFMLHSGDQKVIDEAHVLGEIVLPKLETRTDDIYAAVMAPQGEKRAA